MADINDVARGCGQDELENDMTYSPAELETARIAESHGYIAILSWVPTDDERFVSIVDPIPAEGLVYDAICILDLNGCE